MPLNRLDQINLLKDILSNHTADCCGSVTECEQVERLVKSLMAQHNLDGNVIALLEEIYNYSQEGIQSSNLDSHITTYQPKLTQWVEEMNELY
ncbi:YtzH-like protein [Bacillus oleivorans]|uniref:YtzH-like protein n=1 Tax=Bacillus oleivorans TaxID=1448271 RepID=A0A285CV91_9BACI|nr:YtzH-like family protein [Bacillus oleivorans]SNX71335.1 YtzH-like protein [Bacillus oleivorans]